MKKFETISAANFEAMSKKAIDNQPLRKEVSLKTIQVLHDDVMSIDGRPVKMTAGAFKDLCKIVGLPVGFDKTFTGTFGDKARQALINRLKTVAASKGSTAVSLVLAPGTRQIVGIQKDPKEIISNRTFLDTTTRIIDRYGLEVNSFSVGSHGEVAINASSPKNAFSIGGLPNEDHYGGISFNNSPDGGFMVSPFLHRLVCANGMVGKAFTESMQLEGVGPGTMEIFWNQIADLARRKFKPLEYENKIREAMVIKASLSEMENAYQLIRSLSDTAFNEVEAWIPYQETRGAFHNHGVDTVTLSNAQKKCAKTGTTIWELINGMTHFATHDNGFKIDDYDRSRLQVSAGDVLSKPTWDMTNIVSTPF